MTLYERYNTDDNTFIYVYGTRWVAQTFTIGNTGTNESHDITSVKLKLYRDGLPGTVTVSIRNVDANGHPTGSDLTSGTLDGNSVTTDTNGLWYEITLPSYNLQASTKYALVVRAPDGDSSNTLCWKCDNTSPTYTGGNTEISNDSASTWSTYSGIDQMFEEYGEASATYSLGCNTNTIISKRYEYYNTNDDDYIIIYGDYWRGQTFTVPSNEGHDIIGVKLKLYRAGTPGTVTVSIRETDIDGLPTGNDLTSGTLNGDSLTSDSDGEWYFVPLSSYTLSAGTKYIIIVRAPSGTGLSDSVRWLSDSSSPTYTGGSYCRSTNGGATWDEDVTKDLMFEEYGLPPEISTYSKTYSINTLLNQISGRDNPIDILLESFIPRNYVIDSNLASGTSKYFSINSILEKIGKWVSPIHGWGQSSKYWNIQANSNLNGGRIKIKIDVSDNSDMSNIKGSKTIFLSGGQETIDISDLPNSYFVRYTIYLGSSISGDTPRLHKLVMNVEGLGAVSFTKYQSLNLLLIEYNKLISYVYNLLVSILAKSVETDYDVLTFISNKTGINIDILLEMMEKISEIDLDTLLSSTIGRNYILDTLVSRLETPLTFDLDALVSASGLEINHILDTISTRLAAIVDYIMTTDLVQSLKESLITDILLLVISKNTQYIDIILSKINEKYISMDSIVSKLGISVETTIDILMQEGIIKNMSIDTITGLLGANEYSLDSLLISIGVGKLSALDTLLQKLEIQQLYSFDSYITMEWFAKYYDFDTIIEKFSLSKDVILDILVERIYTKDISFNTIFEGSNIKLETLVDIIAKRVNIPKSYLLNLLTSQSNLVSNPIDTILNIISMTKEEIFDVLISLLNQNKLTYDALIKGARLENMIFNMLLSRLSVMTDITLDTLLSILGRTSLDYDVNVLSHVENKYTFDSSLKGAYQLLYLAIDTYLQMKYERVQTFDMVLSLIASTSYLLDIILLGERYNRLGFDTTLFKYVFIDYARASHAPLFTVSSSSSPLYTINTSQSSAWGISASFLAAN